MQTQSAKLSFEHVDMMRKRIELLIGAKVHDRNKVLKASQGIDKLRRKVSGLNSVEIIRKFRGPI